MRMGRAGTHHRSAILPVSPTHPTSEISAIHKIGYASPDSCRWKHALQRNGEMSAHLEDLHIPLLISLLPPVSAYHSSSQVGRSIPSKRLSLLDIYPLPLLDHILHLPPIHPRKREIVSRVKAYDFATTSYRIRGEERVDLDALLP